MDAREFAAKIRKADPWERYRVLRDLVQARNIEENRLAEEAAADGGELPEDDAPLVEEYTKEAALALLTGLEVDAKEGHWTRFCTTNTFVGEFAQSEEDCHQEVVRQLEKPITKVLPSIFDRLFSRSMLANDPGSIDMDDRDDQGNVKRVVDNARIKFLKLVLSLMETHPKYASRLSKGIMDEMYENLIAPGARERIKFLSPDVALSAVETLAGFMCNDQSLSSFCSPPNECQRKFTTLLNFAWNMAPRSVRVLSTMLNAMAMSAKMLHGRGENPVVHALERWVCNTDGHFKVGDDMRKGHEMVNIFKGACKRESEEDRLEDIEKLEQLLFDTGSRKILRLDVSGCCISEMILNTHRIFATDEAICVVLRPDDAYGSTEDEVFHLDYINFRSAFFSVPKSSSSNLFIILVKTQGPYPVEFFDRCEEKPTHFHIETSDKKTLHKLKDLFRDNGVKIGNCMHTAVESQTHGSQRFEFTDLTFDGEEAFQCSQPGTERRCAAATIDSQGFKVEPAPRKTITNSVAVDEEAHPPSGQVPVENLEDGAAADDEKDEYDADDGGRQNVGDMISEDKVSSQKCTEEESFKDMKYTELRQECFARGLSGKGKKDELLDRLSQSVTKTESQSRRKSPVEPNSSRRDAHDENPQKFISHSFPGAMNPVLTPPKDSFKKELFKKGAPPLPKKGAPPLPNKDPPALSKALGAAKPKPSMSDFDFTDDDKETKNASDTKTVTPKKKPSPSKGTSSKPSPEQAFASAKRVVRETSPDANKGRTRRSDSDAKVRRDDPDKEDEEGGRQADDDDFAPPRGTPSPEVKQTRTRNKRPASDQEAAEDAAEEEEKEEEEFKPAPAKKPASPKKVPAAKSKKEAPKLQMEVSSSSRTSAAAKKREDASEVQKPAAKKAKSSEQKGRSSKKTAAATFSDDDDDEDAPGRGMTDSNLSKHGTHRKKPSQLEQKQQQSFSAVSNKYAADDDLSDQDLDEENEDFPSTPLQPTHLGFGEEPPLASKRKRSPKMRVLQTDGHKSVELTKFNFKGRGPAQQNIADLINDALNGIAKRRRLRVTQQGEEMETELTNELHDLKNQRDEELNKLKKKRSKQMRELEADMSHVEQHYEAQWQQYRAKIAQCYRAAKAIIESAPNLRREKYKELEAKLHEHAAKARKECHADIKKLEKALSGPSHSEEGINEISMLVQQLIGAGSESSQ